MGPSSALWERLLDDTALVGPVAASVAAHRRHREAWYGGMIGALVVSDQRLAEVGRAATPEPLDVSVVNTTGAGGLLSLAGRRVAGVRVVSVESALRDLSDLAGNAARVVAAAEVLDDDVRVFVEIPYAPGWERAVAVVEEAGLFAQLRTGGEESVAAGVDQLARQLSVLIEADLPFRVTAETSTAPPGQHGLLNLVAAVAVLVDGASVDEAATVLRQPDARGLAAQIAGWSEGDATRVRRRLCSFGCGDVLDLVGDLISPGLLTESA